jgi:hypothetical protein
MLYLLFSLLNIIAYCLLHAPIYYTYISIHQQIPYISCVAFRNNFFQCLLTCTLIDFFFSNPYSYKLSNFVKNIFMAGVGLPCLLDIFLIVYLCKSNFNFLYF